ncbi:hypothetical protein ABTY61_28760 [Kitasatospora sp. NPDC096128]|uniref:hypothetical protein n=1 Tax=Kitasatospora sp. NPDC096128 TaxID=3155547 RepID=UPI00332DCE4D
MARTLREPAGAGLVSGVVVIRLPVRVFVAHPDAHPDADTDEDPGSPNVGHAPAGGMVARVEALEQALAEAVGQIADLRTRVEAVELGGTHQG